jgi:hypothetical protein
MAQIYGKEKKNSNYFLVAESLAHTAEIKQDPATPCGPTIIIYKVHSSSKDKNICSEPLR